MYAHLYINYGQITDKNLEEARLGITAQFEFARLPMEQYLFKVQKCQQLHGNAIPPRPITDDDAMGIVYLNIQRSGLYPLDCREWEMRPENLKTMPLLRAVFVSAERRLRAQRGMGVPQGLANNLKHLQRALEGLIEATAQERVDAANARDRNDQLQAAINTLQLQVAAGMIGGTEANALQVQQQQPPQMQAPPQQMWNPPPMNMGWNMHGAPAIPMQQWQALPPIPPQWMQQQQQGFSQPPGGRQPRGRGRCRGRVNAGIPFQQGTYMQCSADQGGGSQRNMQ